MKAPDKIYLTKNDPNDSIDFDTDVKYGSVMWEQFRLTDHDIAYIRKDFLLEWLDKMKEDLIKDSDFRDTEVGRYDSIITIRYKIEQL